MTLLSRLNFVGLAREAVPGTYQPPNVYIPAKGTPEDVVAPLRDESWRSNYTVVQDIYGGPAHSTYDLVGDFYPDTGGNMLRAMFGGDTVTGVAPNFLHTFKTALAQADSYSLTEYNTFEARGYPGCKLDTLNIKIDPKGIVSYDAKWMGLPSAGQATPVPVFTTTQPLLGWQWTMSVGGVPSTRGLSLDYTIKRATETIPSSTGTQGPREIFGAGVEFDAKLKAIFENNLDFNNLLTYAKTNLVATLTQPPAAGGAVLTISSNRSVWHKAVTSKQNYMQLDADITGTYNTVDGGAGAVTLLNAQSAVY